MPLGFSDLLGSPRSVETILDSYADGAVLTLSNDPQGLRPPDHLGGRRCSDRRLGFPRRFQKKLFSQKLSLDEQHIFIEVARLSDRLPKTLNPTSPVVDISPYGATTGRSNFPLHLRSDYFFGEFHSEIIEQNLLMV